MGATQSNPRNTYDFKVLAAIDFGTANTGYGFALVDDPGTILTGKFDNMMDKDREPTILLLNPDKSFHSFGTRARSNFFKLETVDQPKYYYFRLFKMELYAERKLGIKTTIKDYANKEMAVIDIFCIIIQHIFGLAHTVLDKHYTLGIERNDIQWLLTVPAIWSDAAREFMTEAMRRAGADSTRIRLLLEPEAASMYCRKQLMHIVGRDVKELPIGHKYILADLGGGTVDICVHEVIENSKLRELQRVTEGQYGGNCVNQAFENIMIRIIGGPAWQSYKDKFPESFFDLMERFEMEKCAFSGQRGSTLLLDRALLDLTVSENGGNGFEDCLPEVSNTNGMSFDKVSQRLTIDTEAMKMFFEASVNNIVSLVRNVLEQSPEINNILLVGGFAESQYLRQKIEQVKPGVRLILQTQPELAVMKGAVLMGLQPKGIVQRRSRYTYGFSKTREFSKGDPEETKIKLDGKYYCDEVFDVLISAGDILKYDTPLVSESREYNLGEKRNDPVTIKLYRSENKSPKYCNESHCVEDATVRVVPPINGWPNSVKFKRRIIVSETRLDIEIEDMYTGTLYKSSTTFLE